MKKNYWKSVHLSWHSEVMTVDEKKVIAQDVTSEQADLISAAPELLDAVESYLNDLDGKKLEDSMFIEMKLRNAVKKARGDYD